MPNWVTNVLRIDCDDATLDKIKKSVASEKSVFDFNKIVPMPDSLMIDDISDASWALHVLYYKPKSEATDADPYGEEDWDDTDKYKAPYSTDEEIRKRFDKLPEARKEQSIELAKQYKHNIDNYGCKTWYEWSCENWGTKWNSSQPEAEGDEIRFDTAWSTPYPIFKKLSEMYPEATLRIDFADEDIGQNCGTYELKNGNELSYEEGNEDFALALKGWSKEDFDEDNDEN